jgi:hypothetical protein
MRHRGWVDVAALLLMAGAAWLVREIAGNDTVRAIRGTSAGQAGELGIYVWVPLLTAAFLALASALMLTAARVPGLARSSPRAAGVLVVLGAAAVTAEWLRYLALAADSDGAALRGWSFVLPVTCVVSFTALATGIAVPLLRGSRSGPAVTGAAVVWGAVMAVVLVRNPLLRPEIALISLSSTEPARAWLVASGALLVVAAGLLVTAWCAGPPAGRERLLARCRGGYAAVALLLAPVVAVDVTVLSAGRYDPGDGVTGWWLPAHALLVAGAAVSAAGAALVPRATAALAGVVPVLGLAAGGVSRLPAADDVLPRLLGVVPVLVGAVVPVVLAAVVAYACRRLPPEAPPAGEPGGAPVSRAVA